MRNLYLKIFKRSEIVRVFITFPDHRTKMYYVIPDNGLIKIASLKSTYTVDESAFYLFKGTPTLYFAYDRVEPIDPMKLEKSVLSPSYFDSAISTKAVQEFFLASSNSMPPATILTIVGVAITVVMVVMGYFIVTEIQTLQEQINQIGDVILP